MHKEKNSSNFFQQLVILDAFFKFRNNLCLPLYELALKDSNVKNKVLREIEFRNTEETLELLLKLTKEKENYTYSSALNVICKLVTSNYLEKEKMYKVIKHILPLLKDENCSYFARQAFAIIHIDQSAKNLAKKIKEDEITEYDDLNKIEEIKTVIDEIIKDYPEIDWKEVYQEGIESFGSSSTIYIENTLKNPDVYVRRAAVYFVYKIIEQLRRSWKTKRYLQLLSTDTDEIVVEWSKYIEEKIEN